MIYSFGLSLGENPYQWDYSTPDLFVALLSNPDTQFIHLIELSPYDDTLPVTITTMPPMGTTAFGEFSITFGGGERKVYLSDLGFTTTPTDSEPNRHYKALVDNPMEMDSSILSGMDFGAGSISFGSIVIQNGDGELDALSDYQWSGRSITIKVGVQGLPYSQFKTVFSGAVADIETDDDEITLTVRDNRIRTDQFINVALYAGTGGLEGGADLLGRPKPVCYGEVYNIEPVLVDAPNLVYQIHNGSIQDVPLVRDSGVPLTFGGDVADITASVPGAGQYLTQLSGGYIKLGSTPSGRVTADAKGDNAGGYVSTVGGLVKRVAKTLPIRPFSSADIDDGAFARIDAAVPGSMGFYLTEQTSATEVIDGLLLPCLAYWNFTRTGALTGGAVSAPSTPSASLTTDMIEENGLKRERTIPPAWRISVGYAPLGIIQGEDELAGGTSASDRAFLTAGYRYVTYQDNDIRSKYDQATDITFPTRLTNKADAQALLERLKLILMVKRAVFTAPLLGNLYRRDIGETINIQYPRYQLDAGVNLFVVGVGESANTGETVLGLWG
ncbi:hypothetical protein [Methylobacterium oryzae]|uniref:hypothetical protein n=1 Tax=Methylobacterium oryzae TaxID=334852 RepID=UPI002F327B86